MNHVVIESLLKNKFVMHKVCDRKYNIQRLGYKIEKYPVMIEVLDGRFIMYRSRVAFYKSYIVKKFNIIQFINNYLDLLDINVNLEIYIRNLYHSKFTLKFVLKHSNQICLLQYQKYEDMKNAVNKVVDDFLIHIVELIKNTDYITDPNIPNEFKSFINNSGNWISILEVYWLSRKTHDQVKLLKIFMNMQKAKGITYENVG